jgi:peptide/nickel transport system substrate-binding protein/oligopeptide transport system substrate-binding protein
MKIYQTADIENLILCQVVQHYLKDINIRADIVQLEWSSFLEAVTKGEAQSFWLSWWADYPDAENFLFPTFHSTNRGPGGNRSRFSNNRVDDLMFQAVKVLDDKKRSEMYKQIEEIIIDQAPWIFFWHKASVAVCQPWVKGYSVAPIPVMEKWNELRTSH